MILVMLFYIPRYYRIVAEVPPQGELNIDKGEFVLEDKGRRGYRVGLKNKGEIKYFTCRYNLGGSHDLCKKSSLDGPVFTGKYLKLYVGKKATIHWFKQPIYLFYKQNRIASVSIDGVTVLSYDEVRSGIDRHANIGFTTYFSVILLLFIWYIGYYSNKDF